MICVRVVLCFFKQKTAYEMRISDWSSDVCSSETTFAIGATMINPASPASFIRSRKSLLSFPTNEVTTTFTPSERNQAIACFAPSKSIPNFGLLFSSTRSEEHTSELQSLMRISYAVFCLKKKTKHTKHNY